jgi:hypothetical protein
MYWSLLKFLSSPERVSVYLSQSSQSHREFIIRQDRQDLRDLKQMARKAPPHWDKVLVKISPGHAF